MSSSIKPAAQRLVVVLFALFVGTGVLGRDILASKLGKNNPAAACFLAGCEMKQVGDGKCDLACFNEACDWDLGDCTNNCPSECPTDWIGDDLCDSVCNVEECGFDGGDCEECAADCFLPLLGDGECQPECFNLACEFDKGDCFSQCAPGCEGNMLGDGVCDPECNTTACNNDKGDCITCDPDGSCFAKSMLGDGICDLVCYNEACRMDGGDCDGMCAPGCEPDMIGDGYCDNVCNSDACQQDGGDCLPLPDGTMPHVYYADGRDYTTDYEEDEECAPGCYLEWLGDGYCIDVCNNDACGKDGGDCLPLPDGTLPPQYHANGLDYTVDYEEDGN
eukprot:jgi/Tetstr1/428629/TSEL_018618.t1